MDPRIVGALGTLDFGAEPSAIPRRLPSLDAYRSRHESVDLSAHHLLMIQHQLGTNVALLRALVDDGIAPERTWFVDIPYSTHLRVREALLDLAGAPDRCPAPFTDPLVDYGAAQLTRVISTLLAMHARGHQADLLVLDDGAYFMRALGILRAIGHPAADAFRGSRVVEQTTRGHEYLRIHADDLRQLRIRAVSIARSVTKLQFEAPFVGASVATSLATRAGRLRPQGVEHVAVLGFGAIGEACAGQLQLAFPDAAMTIVDGDPSRRRSARAAHPDAAAVLTRLPAARRSRTGRPYDLVVGCTGRNSFTLQDRSLLAPGAILASGSSAAVEFDRAGFLDLADYRDDDDIEVIDREHTRAAGIHADITLRLDNQVEVVFANAGFPVNFDGRLETLPEEAIEPTRCLMYAATHQVVRQEEAERRGLDRESDDWIHAQALASLPG